MADAKRVQYGVRFDHRPGVADPFLTLARDLHGSADMLRPGGEGAGLADPHHLHPGGG
jgi:hypothetical protein